MIMKKDRIDRLLVQRNLAETRTKAQALIMAGSVFYDEYYSQRVLKPSETLSVEAELFVKQELPYVSRGGVKLKGAIEKFGIDFKDKIVLDVGASTGGFTDCALQEGALRIYSLDVGKSLIDEKLKRNEKVIVIEKNNFRYFNPSQIEDDIDLITVDVSFISLELILQKIYETLIHKGIAIILVKPQFELEKKQIKKGIVRSEADRKSAIEKIIKKAKENGFLVKDICDSTIKGAKGNLESFIFLEKPERS